MLCQHRHHRWVCSVNNLPHLTNLQVIYKYYDFIIIGGGSGGAVVANRLSEVEDWNILLLEAGGDETETSDVPALAAFLQLSELDWQYKTEPQSTACLGMTDQRFINILYY